MANMVKIVTVSMSQNLLAAATQQAKAQKMSRAGFIRRALECYVQARRVREMEEADIRGYQRIPEDVREAEVGAKLAALVFSDEKW